MNFHIERNYTFTNETKMNMSDKNKRTSDKKEISHSLRFSGIQRNFLFPYILLIPVGLLLPFARVEEQKWMYTGMSICLPKGNSLSFFQVSWFLCLKSARISPSAIFHCLSVFITTCLAVSTASHPISSFI